MTLEFNGLPWTTTGHLIVPTSSFVHHFIAIGQFKLALQSGNAKFGSKSAIFCPGRPWNLMDDLEKQWVTFQALCSISSSCVRVTIFCSSMNTINQFRYTRWWIAFRACQNDNGSLLKHCAKRTVCPCLCGVYRQSRIIDAVQFFNALGEFWYTSAGTFAFGKTITISTRYPVRNGLCHYNSEGNRGQLTE